MTNGDLRACAPRCAFFPNQVWHLLKPFFHTARGGHVQSPLPEWPTRTLNKTKQKKALSHCRRLADARVFSTCTNVFDFFSWLGSHTPAALRVLQLRTSLFGLLHREGRILGSVDGTKANVKHSPTGPTDSLVYRPTSRIQEI